MKILIILWSVFLSLVIPGHSVAQQNNRIWYFGQLAGLDFNSGTPVRLSNGLVNTVEGCATITDDTGGLLFYSDGITVWNKNHFVMSGGTSLLGGSSTTQSVLIEQLPGSPGIYYVFTLADQTTAGSFTYSVVDMSLQGGLGMVTAKNVFIATNMSEKITSISNNAGSNTWIVVHERGNNNFRSYALTQAGITLSPVISAAGDAIINNEDNGGQMKLSPDKTKLAVAFKGSNFINLFDFSVISGGVSDPKRLTLPGAASFGAYGLEFSPSSGLLYGTTLSTAVIHQWDVTLATEANINSSRVQVGTATATNTGSMQLAPDGKIYLVKYNSTFLSAISLPNQSGLACTFVDNAVSIGPTIGQLGLPNYVQAGPGTVPVSFLSFTGKNRNEQNFLYWSTSSENNNSYFSIERNSGANEFHSIGRINGAGQSSQILNYGFVDDAPLPGVNFYRLTQIDFDGQSSSTRTISIKNSADKSSLHISPNPAKDFIQLYFNEAQNNFKVEIINSVGVIILKASNRSKLDVSKISKGMYVVIVKAGGLEYRSSFIKS